MDALRNLLSKRVTFPSKTVSGEGNEQHGLTVTAPSSEPLTILELFQSQGCSSCPPTESNLHSLLPHNSNLLLLTYDVTYWDHLGWIDTFGNKAWDERQRAYSAKWGRRSVFTPQVVVDGVVDGVGGREGEVKEMVGRARSQRAGGETRIDLKVDGNELVVSGETEQRKLDVLLVVFDPKARSVDIERGENGGKTLQHWNLVKEVRRIGEWRGGNMRVSLPESTGNDLERVVLLQAGAGGEICAALST